MLILRQNQPSVNELEDAITEFLSVTGVSPIRKIAQACGVEHNDPRFLFALRRLRNNREIEITMRGFRMVKALETIPF